MLSKDIITVYAQYNEDIIIASLLSNVKNGFYVDVGANHESYHSVTKYFYKQGWSGINIEPNERLLSEFNKKRNRDINICAAISDHNGVMEFREYTEHDGFSTLSSESKAELSDSGIPFVDYEVKVMTLKDIFKKYNVRKIDFIKIDVEGYESEVIMGNDWHKYQPSLICIEANHKKNEWSKILLDAGYKLVIFDGLNEYYLSKDSQDNFLNFADRATLMSHSALRHHYVKAWGDDLSGRDAAIKILQKSNNEQQDRLHALTDENILSLKNKTFSQRLKIFIKGITIDYVNYRKKLKN